MSGFKDDEAKIKSQLEDESAKYAKLLKIEPTDHRDNRGGADNRDSRKRERERSPRRNNSPRNEDKSRRRSNEKRRSPERNRSAERRVDKRRSDSRNRSVEQRKGDKRRSGSRHRSAENKQRPVEKNRSPERKDNHRRPMDMSDSKHVCQFANCLTFIVVCPLARPSTEQAPEPLASWAGSQTTDGEARGQRRERQERAES